MNLYFFGILIASRKHKTFAQVEGDLTAIDMTDAKYEVTNLAYGLATKTNDKSIFVVGIHVIEASQIKVPDYV